MKDTDAIEYMINNALETQFNYIEDENFSEMREEHSKKFDENTSKIIKLEKTILSMLPIEGQKMYLEIETLSEENSALEIQYMFKKGVIEGLTTFEYLKKISKCVYLPSMKI
jgi:hypothetical protein